MQLKELYISNKQIVGEDIHDGITNVQVTNMWITYVDTIVQQMFDEYQTQRNTICLVLLI